MCFCFRTKKKYPNSVNHSPGTVPARQSSVTAQSSIRKITSPPTPGPGQPSDPEVSAVLASTPGVTPHSENIGAQATAATQSTVQSPWEIAINRLKPEDRLIIDFNSQTKLDILCAFAQEAESQRQECEGKQWRYKNSRGEEVLIRDGVNSLLLNVKKYTSIGDLVIQPLPSVVSLAWGGFKVLLQLAIADMENTAIAMECLESLARVLCHCSIYENLYSQQGLKASKSLNDALVCLYALILEYLCYLKRHLTRTTAGQAFRNIAGELKSQWDELLVMETAVDKEAGIAHQEATGKHLYEQNKGMEKMVGLLMETNALREPILEIQGTLEETKSKVEATQRTLEDTKAKVDDIFKSIKEDERLAILNWLSSSASPKMHHRFVKSFRTPGTGGWLLDKPNFRKWNNSGVSSFLWLHGIAGSGKTILASTIIDHVEKEMKNTPSALAYFYCNYKEEERRDPATILRSLVKQLCMQSPKSRFPKPVSSIYNERRENADLSNYLSVEESKCLLIELSGGFTRTTIVIDALDECDFHTRGILFKVVEDIVSSSTRTKAFVTSRDDSDFRKQFENSPNIYIQERDISGDVSDYIKTEIAVCIKSKRLLGGNVGDALESHIIGALEKGAQGMFIWVNHQINKICSEIDEHGVREALKELPKGLDGMYDRILHSIKTIHESPRRFAMAEKALKWILYAVRPLSPDELLALISAPSANGDCLMVADVLDICQNFVIHDKELQVLRFAHYSVQEFLGKHFIAEKGHTDVAEDCLTTLLNLSAYSPAVQDYVTFNWAAHIGLSGAGSDTLTSACNQFLRPSIAYDTWVSRVSVMHDELWPPPGQKLSPLLVVCFYQLSSYFLALLDSGIDVNAKNKYGQNSCHLAAIVRNEDAMRGLLKRDGVEVDIRDTSWGKSPLSWAAEMGHEKMVQILVDKGVDLESRDTEWGQSPLIWAAENGHEKVVQILVDNGADGNSKSEAGRSPLSYAAKNGHEEVAQILREKGAK